MRFGKNVKYAFNFLQMKKFNYSILILLVLVVQSCASLRIKQMKEKATVLPLTLKSEKQLDGRESFVSLTPLWPLSRYTIDRSSNFVSLGVGLNYDSYKYGSAYGEGLYNFNLRNRYNHLIGPPSFDIYSPALVDSMPKIEYKFGYSFPVIKRSLGLHKKAVILENTRTKLSYFMADVEYFMSASARIGFEHRNISSLTQDTAFRSQFYIQGPASNGYFFQTSDFLHIGGAVSVFSLYQYDVTTENESFKGNSAALVEASVDFLLGTKNQTRNVLNIDGNTISPADYLNQWKNGFEFGLRYVSFDKRSGSVYGVKFGMVPGYFEEMNNRFFFVFTGSFNLNFVRMKS